MKTKTWDELSAALDALIAARAAETDPARRAAICKEAQAVIAYMRVRWSELCAPPGRR